MRLVGTLFAEQDDEWQVADRRYFSIGSMVKVDELERGEDPKELLAGLRSAAPQPTERWGFLGPLFEVVFRVGVTLIGDLCLARVSPLAGVRVQTSRSAAL